MLRAVINNVLAIPLFLGFYLHDALATLFRRRGHTHYRIGRNWSRALLKASGVRLTVKTHQLLDPARQYVFVSNHLSYLDTPVMYAALPAPFRFIARSNLFRLPIIGAHLRHGGHLGIEREDGRSAIRTLAEAARVIAARKVSILIFAEGTRSRGGLQAFRSGASWLALKAGVDLVPVAVRGTNHVLARGSRLIRSAPVEVTLGEPISVAGLTMQDRDHLTTLLQERVAVLLGNVSAAVHARAESPIL